ncbi:uncharacterized protein C6orf118-like [Amphiura filiformis]|uniref:uncharacterized protein C6orf118-like n=1 Tax=Amphiura filiformis TaxID=82378 RepID=UPI003B20D3F0
MADSESLKSRPLHDLVEGLFQEHKHDIHLHCHGHLNYKNLYTPPERVSHKPWTSSSTDAPIPVMRKPSKLPSPRRTKEKDTSMKEAMYDFSMGTAGSLPLQGGKGLGTPYHKKDGANRDLESRTTFSTARTHSRNQDSRLSTGTPFEAPGYGEQRQNSVASYIADNVYIEELRLPELMLPASIDHRTKNLGRSMSPVLAPIGGADKDSRTRHQFVETHLGGITKKDQFNRFKNFQDGVLKTSEMFEKGVLSGRKAVEHLEMRLREDLLVLDDVHRQSGPNFHRLQIYNNAWQSLIADSPIFQEILSDIKAEYEVYMGSLLDTQPHKQSQVLCQQVDNLSAGSPVVPGEVKEGHKHVQRLEADAKELLEENDRLREQVRMARERIENESKNAKEAPRSAVRRVKSRKRDEKTSSSVAEQILELHAGILIQMEELSQLRAEIHQNYVPISVCQHLDQCVRDTEAEVLKVLSTNEYLEKTIQQLEVDMEKIMERGNAPDTDTRQIWKSINTMSASSHDTL